MRAILTACLVALATPSLAQQTAPQIPFDSAADFPKLPDGMHHSKAWMEGVAAVSGLILLKGKIGKFVLHDGPSSSKRSK